MAASNTDENYGSQEIFYSNFYKSVIFGKGFGPRAVRKTHRSMEAPFTNCHFGKVLEIGGGTGEHLDFVRHTYDEYFVTDLKLPVLKSEWSANPKIRIQEANAEALPFEDRSFDRVISTCLLHHVEKPETVLNEILRVLKPAGVATIFLSCDPGIAVRVLRAISTARNARKEGYKGYELMIARDHRNHVGSLLQMVRFTFRGRSQDKRFFPFRIPSWNLNGYVVIQISDQLNLN